jgi:hypothetical protein
MKTPKSIKILPALLAIALILAACEFPSGSTEEQIALGIAQTQVALTQTALAGPADPAQPTLDGGDPQPPAESSPTPSQTPEPSLTPSPTITLTPTPDTPTVSVSIDTNCRRGPGKQYDIIGALLVGETAQVTGKSADGIYWIIQNPDRAGECWLWANYATVTGPTDALPVVTQPPTPTPQFHWTGAWDTVRYPLGGMGIVLSMSTTVNGRDFSGSMGLPGMDPLLFSGTISDDWLSVSGTWTQGADEGTFRFFAVGTNQFNGSSRNGEVLQWCGGRDGAGFPDPCYKE